MLSDGFSEGQTRNINDIFPSDLLPYTEDYDYLSDSDLEDDEDLGPQDSDSQVHLTVTPEHLSRLSQDVSEVGGDNK